MGRQPAFWSRELATTSVQYLAVGVAFIPWGMIYAFFKFAGWDHWLLVVCLLLGGFFTAHFAWIALENKSVQKLTLVITPSSMSASEVVREVFQIKQLTPATVLPSMVLFYYLISAIPNTSFTKLIGESDAVTGTATTTAFFPI